MYVVCRTNPNNGSLWLLWLGIWFGMVVMVVGSEVGDVLYELMT